MSDLEARVRDTLRARADTAFRLRRRRQAELAENPDIPHGKVSTYSNWMCRCPLCRQAKAAANANRPTTVAGRRASRGEVADGGSSPA